MLDQRKRIRLLMLTVLVLPVVLFGLGYFAVDHRFEHVAFQYTLAPGGDTVFHRLPAFALPVAGGDTLRDSDLRGGVSYLSFVGCEDDAAKRRTVLLGNLKRFYDNIEWDKAPAIRFITLSTGDSLPQVRALADSVGLPAAHWTFAATDTAQLARLIQELRVPGFERWQPGDAPFTAQTVVMLDPEGRVRQYYIATDLKEERRMQEDLITLLRLEYPDELKRTRNNR
ncbi:MAG: hypothetical protein OHK0039_31600 [Bacteroidia bacterium]